MKSVIEHRMRNGLCAWCGDKGHHANQCPKRSKKVSNTSRSYSPYPTKSSSQKLSRDAKHRDYKGKERKGYTSRRSDSESSKVKFGLNAIEATDASADEMEQYLRSLTHEEKRNIGVLSDSSSDSHH
jgi:hypothetical protein